MKYTNLLISKGFTLNKYHDGMFWELIVKNDVKLKEHLCDIFKAEIELFIDGDDIDMLVLQCKADFSGCLFYSNVDWFYMQTEDFMECVEQI